MISEGCTICDALFDIPGCHTMATCTTLDESWDVAQYWADISSIIRNTLRNQPSQLCNTGLMSALYLA